MTIINHHTQYFGEPSIRLWQEFSSLRLIHLLSTFPPAERPRCFLSEVLEVVQSAIPPPLNQLLNFVRRSRSANQSFEQLQIIALQCVSCVVDSFRELHPGRNSVFALFPKGEKNIGCGLYTVGENFRVGFHLSMDY